MPMIGASLSLWLFYLGAKRSSDWFSDNTSDVFRSVALLEMEKCRLIKRIVLYWWSLTPPRLPFGIYESSERHDLVMELRNASSVRFGERYNPRAMGLNTSHPKEFVGFLDDDRVFTCESLRMLVTVAMRYPGRITSPNRVCRLINKHGDYIAHEPRLRVLKPPETASIALPAVSVIHASTLAAAFSIIPELLIDVTTNLHNGEDILVNFAVAALRPDGVAANCVHGADGKLLAGSLAGIYTKPKPKGVDSIVWRHRRQIVSVIITRSFTSCWPLLRQKFRHHMQDTVPKCATIAELARPNNTKPNRTSPGSARRRSGKGRQRQKYRKPRKRRRAPKSWS